MARQFEWNWFDDGGRGAFAFDADKYTPEEAKFIASQEDGCSITEMKTRYAWAYYGYGEYDGENLRGYWISESKTGNSFPVIVCERM